MKSAVEGFNLKYDVLLYKSDWGTFTEIQLWTIIHRRWAQIKFTYLYGCCIIAENLFDIMSLVNKLSNGENL